MSVATATTRSLLTPPFTLESATRKARMAEDTWNNQDPSRVALAYTPDSEWRNRSTFLRGRNAIAEFLTHKWQRELQYRLVKDVWAYVDNRIAIRFVYEYHDQAGQWFRAHGNELWQYAPDGLMQRREASINDLAITEPERRLHWPMGPRPHEHVVSASIFDSP
jgi:uncharacterized protein